MAQQTALEWLIEQCPRIETIVAYNILEQAKQMEKEQIVNALERGFDEGYKHPEDITLKNAEQYYNEKYSK
jgi:lipoate-protein ligase A